MREMFSNSYLFNEPIGSSYAGNITSASGMFSNVTSFSHPLSAFSDRILANIASTGLFSHFLKSFFFRLGFLVISLVGSKEPQE